MKDTLDPNPAFSTVQTPNADHARAEVVATIGLLRDNGARMTAYLLAGMAARDETEHEISTAGLQRCLMPVKIAVAALLGNDAVEDLDPKALEWMRNELKKDVECLKATKALSQYLTRFSENIDTGQPCALDEIFASLAIVRDQFITPFNAFIERLQDIMKKDRAARVAHIQESASRARHGVDLIGEIARTVRMVSINAQIEAARAGDNGRAFSIIAQEINALSDEISRVGTTVKDGLSDTLDFA
ncbi:methyl-accepting chemotaxis protein [Algirhabdus cladophorae]|uniref:methyl-accepting chemotaxis protein n=1 Tax=Algirhabdus cladophorae TaxID=3377108 RepID=UPI003B849D23